MTVEAWFFAALAVFLAVMVVLLVYIHDQWVMTTARRLHRSIGEPVLRTAMFISVFGKYGLDLLARLYFEEKKNDTEKRSPAGH